jgi:UDP:flavonoid glycosyltransferase YjiC (YdhE family)
MQIGLIAFGTRGDVQPIIALAKGLQSAGYGVQVAAGTNFEAWIRSHGLDFAPISVDIQAMMNSEGGKAWANNSSSNPMQELQTMRTLFKAHGIQAAHDLYQICEAADVMISGFTTLAVIETITTKLKKRHIAALLQPASKTRAGAALTNPFVQGNSILNLGASWFYQSLLWYLFSPVVKPAREQWQLPPYHAAQFRQMLNQLPIVYGFSEHIIPRPADWGEQAQISGYWFLDEPDWTPPQSLSDFLNAGSPPMYIGFGSMSNRNPEATLTLILDALRQSGQRGIISSGWSGLKAHDLPDTVYLLESAPHSWLFPRMAGVVHHGGAGTTAAALRAGVPMTIVPHIADQPFWGRRTAEIGATLAAALRTLATNTIMQQKAAAIGKKIRAEEGVSNAVYVIQKMLNP